MAVKCTRCKSTDIISTGQKKFVSCGECKIMFKPSYVGYR